VQCACPCVDHGADDELAGFDSNDSKEEMVVAVAAMDRLARGTRETQGALDREVNTKRGAADVEEGTEGARGGTYRRA
jgi:hypothetical protein